MASQKLTVGDFGDEVALLHDDLTRRGYHVPAGEMKRKFFGPATRAAVAECQRCHQLAVSGYLDEATAAILSTARLSASPVAATAPRTPVPECSVSTEAPA